jgi:hypothetical protein
VAGSAINIDRTRCGGVRVGFAVVCGKRSSIDFVLVLVVTHVLGRGGRVTFMLAITGHCSPTELHRQENHKKDE